MPYKQSGTRGEVNGAVPKRLRPMMAETDCDVIHCPTVGRKHWMFDPWLADVVNQLARSNLAALGILS